MISEREGEREVARERERESESKTARARQRESETGREDSLYRAKLTEV